MWQHELLLARNDWYKKMYPAATSDHGVPKPSRPYRDDNTNDLTRSIYDWLKYHFHYVNRIQSQGQVRKEKVSLAFGNVREKYTWCYGATNRGSSDLIALINGLHVAIEIKCRATRDRLRPDQVKEKSRIESAGGIYYVARDMQSFIDWYHETFTLQKNVNGKPS
ncbi:MAG TPA: VRR-NUC domain-containing protein [Acidobacteriota bacterium]